MTSKRPTPLKDEPVAPLDELQDLLVKNITATNALNKTLSGCTDARSVSPETVATMARNAVKELLEQRKRKLEREEQEAKAQGRLTPQECYTKLAADYADVLQKCIIVCDTYRYISEAAKWQEARSREVEAKLDALIGMQGVRAADVKKTAFPPRPKRFRNVFAYLFKDIPLYCLRRAYRSRHVWRFVWICLFCIWLITVVTACFIARDNAIMRREKENCPMMHGHRKPAAKTVLRNGRLFLSNDILCGCTGIKKADTFFVPARFLYSVSATSNLQPDGCPVLPMSVSSYSYSVGFRHRVAGLINRSSVPFPEV